MVVHAVEQRVDADVFQGGNDLALIAEGEHPQRARALTQRAQELLERGDALCATENPEEEEEEEATIRVRFILGGHPKWTHKKRKLPGICPRASVAARNVGRAQALPGSSAAKVAEVAHNGAPVEESVGIAHEVPLPLVRA
eukprot:COSAG01_NODE_367_length_18064_cov_23.990315_7_plen_141_part_00